MRDDTTIVLCTHDGRDKSLLARARASAEGQAPIVIADNGPHGQQRCHWTWWGAIYEVKTPKVALLFDDDWWEPDYLDTLAPELDDPLCAYAYSEATIHFPDGSSRVNLGGPPGRKLLSGLEQAHILLNIPYAIACDCIVMRRVDALTCLLPGGSPIGGFESPLGGVDGIYAMLPLLRAPYDHVAWHGSPLVHLDAGAQSCTIDAMHDKGKHDRLMAGYVSARAFVAALVGAKCAST